MIPQSFIQELLARVDVVEVVGRYVQLKKGGANFMGLCPFHGEKSPSFTVSQSKQFYHCFGCGQHGSAISFLMEHLSLSFVDAVQELAQSAGLTVPQEQRENSAQMKQAPGLLQCLEQASNFYKTRLKDTPRAVDYLKARGLSGATAKRFGIGYSPDGWRTLEAAFAEYEAPELVTAGLVIESENSEGSEEQTARKKRYDRFRDRIMFPIRNPKGQVIGFGGRVLDKGEPKYLNSPETPLFSKGRELYGLFEGRDAIRTQSSVLVVEGYMDVVMLHEYGIGNAVATLGTATTPVHIQKLNRLVDRIVFSFDGDKAGQRAARRALETCLPSLVDEKRIDFLFLPAEHDPDSFVRELGQEAFLTAMKNAMPLSEFLVQVLSQDNDLQTPEGRASFQAEARPLIQIVPKAIAMRAQIMRRIASLAQVDVADMEAYLAAKPLSAAMQASISASLDPSFGQKRDTKSLQSTSPFDTDYPSGSGSWEPDFQGGAEQGIDNQQGTQFSSKFLGKSGGKYGGKFGSKLVDKLAIGSYSGPRRPAPLTLEDRARVLAALYPDICKDLYGADGDGISPEYEFCPQDLMDWFNWLRALPPGANFAAVCERLGESNPAAVQQLVQNANSEFAEAQLAVALMEFKGALSAIAKRQVTVRMGVLAQKGLALEADKQEYGRLSGVLRVLANQKALQAEQNKGG